jgi:hypothetical protein
MNENQRTDDIVRAWVRSGPEQASLDLVERALRPVPLMRQRRSWRIVMERWARPALAAAAVVSVIAVILVGVGTFARFGGVGGQPVPVPTFTLTLADGPGEGVYTADPTSTLNQCSHATDGSWRYLYVGGDPSVNLDLVIGPRVAQPDGSSNVALELYAGPGYLRFDPSDIRGGDPSGPAGQSTADVEVRPSSATTTFVIHATTLDGLAGEGAAPYQVELTATCRN